MHKEGTNVRQLFMENGQVAITSRNAKTGETYLALFNINDKQTSAVKVNLNELGIKGKYKQKDLWTGVITNGTTKDFSQSLAPHASKVYSFK